MDFLKIDSEKSFEKLSLELFNFHYKENENYRKFCDNINVDSSKINCIEKIPFLPIVLFKNKKISIKNIKYEIIFESSGTGGYKSKHFIKNLELYNKSIEKCFKNFYGEISDYIIIGVTPSLESKNNSSLIYMINELIKKYLLKILSMILFLKAVEPVDIKVNTLLKILSFIIKV